MNKIFKIIIGCLVVSSVFAQQKPNIIFIMADDMGYGDLGCYGQQLIKTPNIDKLAKEGMRFTDFYAGSTVCAPSRASLMTGQHTGHTFIRGNGELPLRKQDNTLSQYLKQAGYINGMVGKWGLGLQGTAGAPEKKGWDFFVGHLHHVEGHYQQTNHIWRIVNGESKKEMIDSNIYVNELFTQSALQFIQQNKKNPFFLYVSYTLPHAELKVPQKYLQAYLNKDGSSKFAPEVAQPAGLHYGSQPYPKAAYAAMISSMDDYVGQIMQQLKASGLYKNTIVIFASDNGTHTEGGREITDATNFFKSSGALRGIKRDLYEGGIRVPFIVHWNNHVGPGSTSSYTGAFWDILPTLTTMAGLKDVPKSDGISFVPTLAGKSQQRNTNLYWEFNEGGFKQAVRNGNWKAIRFYKAAQAVRTELYDLSTDIGETSDLSAQYPAIVKKMEQSMDKEHTTSESALFKIN